MPVRRIEAGRFGTFVYDPAQDAYEFDDDAKELLGSLVRPDSKYRDMLARMPPNVRRDYEAWRQEAAAGGAGRTRVPFQLPDRTIVLEVQIQPRNGVLRGLLADVSSDERRQQDVEAQLDMMELAARIVRFGVWVYHIKEDHFTASREAVELMLPGVDPTEFTLEAGLELLHPDDRQPVRDAHRGALETGQVQSVEFRSRERWFMAHFVRVLDDAGDPIQTCGMIHETTSLHTHQAMAEEMRGMEAMRARLVNAAAHELSQPIMPMRLQLAALRDLVPTGPGIRHGFEIMERNLERLALMLNDLLDAARSQAGTLRVRMETTDAVQFVGHIVDTLRPLAQTRRVRITWTPTPVPGVAADPQRLQQCISNLVHNAIKFTKEGSEIRIEAVLADGDVMVHVHDEGAGLDEEQSRKAFEPFHQVHRGPPGIPGTGLGLYVTKSLMQAMGGRVEVSSQPGKGSTFTLRLPVA